MSGGGAAVLVSNLSTPDSLELPSETITENLLHENYHETCQVGGTGVAKQPICLLDGSFKSLFGHTDVDHFQLSDDVKKLFEYIDVYEVQEIEIGTVLKPFVPEYIPAVGAIDEFIKVTRPDGQFENLGLKVLDESGPKQSELAVLTLQLRAASKQPSLHMLEVASIENSDKNSKKLDVWINSIKDLNRNRPPSSVIYSKMMPEIESLMQESSTDMDKILSEIQLSAAQSDVDLPALVNICCSALDIPVYKSQVESLHVLFSLYLELKSSLAL